MINIIENYPIQATMLKKNKLKMKRRNTEPTMMVAGSAAPPLSLALPPSVGEVGVAGEGAEAGDGGTNNTDFWIWYSERLI